MVIFGKVTDDSTGREVIGANVLIKPSKSGGAAYFGVTSSKGTYHISIPDTINLSNYDIEVTHLTYTRASQPMVDGKLEYPFRLSVRTNLLPIVNTKRRPHISRSGDTLRYNVQSFTKTIDRSIGDVLRRMPGIEINDEGRISYQGQAISNLYIDGDDLLEGKYGIGTKSIPHVMVMSVEVLKNHQPIKVLKDRVVSRDIAINLVIKNEAKLNLSGEAKIGAGLPKQYLGEVNMMLFNKKHKLLDVLKGNNTGIDLQEHLKDLVDPVAATNDRRMLLSAGTVGNPNIRKERYYLNNSGGLFTNNLINLANDLQLRSNIDLVLDRNTMDYRNRSTIYSATDSFSFNEQLDRVHKPQQLDVNLRATKNSATKYLTNNLKLTYRKDKTEAYLYADNGSIQQTLDQTQWHFNNAFRYIPSLRNGDLLNVDWTFSGYRQPELLEINPASLVSFIDPPTAANLVMQHTTTTRLASQFNIAYVVKPKLFRQRYALSILQEWQALHSSIWLDNNRYNDEIDGAENDLYWKKSQASISGNYHWQEGNWRMNLTLPIGVQYLSYHNNPFRSRNNRLDLLFTPEYYTTLMLGKNNQLEARYSYGNTFGDMFAIYEGAILTNYRTLIANDTRLMERKSHSAGLKYFGGDPISMFFYSAGYTFVSARSNTITALEIDGRRSRLINTPLFNTSVRHTLNVALTKFIFWLGAKSGTNIMAGVIENDQLVNDDLVPYRSRFLSIVPDLNVELLKSMQVNYNGRLSWFLNSPIKPKTAVVQRLFVADQSFRLSYSANPTMHLGLSGRHFLTNGHSSRNFEYLFLDAFIRYKVAKWRTEFELDLTNVTNISTFDYSLLEINSSYSSTYNIRGRMALLKVIFSL